MKKREMADLCYTEIFRADAQMCAGAGAEMAEQALDGRHGAERIVAKADGEGFGPYRSKGQGPEVAGAGELLAEDLRQAQHSLGEITGAFSSDDLLGRIFSSFCIGK